MKLGELMGIRTPEGGYGPQTQIDRGGVPVQAASQMGATGAQPAPGAPAASGSAGMVPMRAPSGQVKMVDPGQVAHFESMGAQVVR